MSSPSSAPSGTQPRITSAAEVKAALGDGLVDSFFKNDLWLRVRTDAWKSSMRTLRDTLGVHYFNFLSAIDWMPSPYGRGEDDPTESAPVRDTTIRQGYAGGATRLQVFARVGNPITHVSVTIKADVPDDSPRIESIHDVYAGANWHERETHEMFGIAFDGHPDLRNMYLPVDFEGHPLRKDFPLLARMIKPWPGIVDVEPLPGGGEDEGGEES
ncbi:MAG: NADH-quinone oxidoreductase subunit C [Actinomycetota bacterium]